MIDRLFSNVNNVQSYGNKTILTSSAVSFGYCTKEGSSDIIEFCKNGNSADSGWYISIISLDGFSQKISQTDEVGTLAIKCRNYNATDSGTSTPTSGEISYNASTDFYKYAFNFLKDDGTPIWGCYRQLPQTHANAVKLCYNYLPYGNSGQNRMYSSFILGTSDTLQDTMEYAMKGFINSELYAFSWQSHTLFSTSSNGKYLCLGPRYVLRPDALMTSTPSSTSTNVYTDAIYLFIGWDNSNPSMTTTAACPLYTPNIDESE